MALRELLLRLGVDIDGKGKVSEVEEEVEQLSESTKEAEEEMLSLGDAVGALGAAVAVAGIADFVGETLELANEQSNLASQVGLTSAKMQLWTATAKSVGREADDVQGALGTLGEKIFEANQEAGEARELFDEMGVSYQNADGSARDIGQTAEELLSKLAKTEDQSKKVFVANTLMSDSGLRLIPAFEQGGVAAQGFGEDLEELTKVYSEDFLKQQKEATASFGIFGLQLTKFRVLAVGALLPALKGLADIFTPILSSLAKMIRDSEKLQKVLQILATAGIGAAAIVIAGKLLPALKALLKVASGGGKAFLWLILIVLLVEDLITAFQGGDSAIGAFIDSIFGAGAATEVIETLKELWEDLGPTIEALGPIIKGIAQIFIKFVAGALALVGLLVSALVAMFGGPTEGIEKFSNLFKSIFASWIDFIAFDVLEPIVNWFSATWDKITGGAAAAVAKVKGFFASIPGVNAIFGGSGGGGGGAGAGAGAPRAPGGGVKNTTLTDQRQISVSVTGVDKSAAPTIAGAAAGAVSGTLTRDRRATLAGVS